MPGVLDRSPGPGLRSKRAWASPASRPEEQQIVTGSVLIVTLIVFGAADIIKTGVTRWRSRVTRVTRI